MVKKIETFFFICKFCKNLSNFFDFLLKFRIIKFYQIFLTTRKCQNCPFTTKTRKSLNKHSYAAHTQNFSCDKCDYVSSIKTDLESHIKSHKTEESQTYFCEICGMEFGKRHLMNRHVKIKHTIKERRFRCENGGCDKGELKDFGKFEIFSQIS